MSDIALASHRPVTTEAPIIRRALIGTVLVLIGLLLLAPLAVVFAEALRQGWAAAARSLASPEARSAIRLTLTVAAIAVPLNAVFGIAAAWAITKFDFRGKAFLITLIAFPSPSRLSWPGWRWYCSAGSIRPWGHGLRRMTSASSLPSPGSCWRPCS